MASIKTFLSDALFQDLADLVSLPPAPTVGLLVDSGSDAHDLLTNDVRLAITAVAGATVEYSFDGLNWSSSPPSGMPDGKYTIHVHQIIGTDVSAASDLTFTFDSTAPGKPTVSLENDTGSDATDRITTDYALKLENIDTGALVEYSLDNGATWSTAAPANLAAGDHTVLVRQSDAAGNYSDSASLAFTVTPQADAPVLTLATDSGQSGVDGITNDASINVTGKVTGATIQYFIDGDLVGVSDLPTSWADGDHSIKAVQTTPSGDTGEQTFVFTLDTVAPDILELALAHDTGTSAIDNASTDATLSVTGAEADALVEYSLDGGKTWSATAPTGLAAGTYTVDVRQTDIAGNVSEATSLTFKLIADPVTSTYFPDGSYGHDGGDFGASFGDAGGWF